LPFIVLSRARLRWLLFRRPRLVIARGAGAMPAAQHRPLRVIGLRRAGQVGLVRLFPGIVRPRAGHLVDRVMQPGVPLRRNLRALRLALVDDPAPLAAEAAAATPGRLVALEAVIGVAIRVRADPLAAQPSQESRPKRRHHPVPSERADYRTAARLG